jgi:hypothetical protein
MNKYRPQRSGQKRDGMHALITPDRAVALFKWQGGQDARFCRTRMGQGFAGDLPRYKVKDRRPACPSLCALHLIPQTLAAGADTCSSHP